MPVYRSYLILLVSIIRFNIPISTAPNAPPPLKDNWFNDELTNDMKVVNAKKI